MSKGRPKAYESITYEELGDYIGKKGVVKVSKPWLDSLMGEITPQKVQEAPPKPDVAHDKGNIVDVDDVVPPIEYNITRFDNE